MITTNGISEWRCDLCRVTQERYKPVKETPKCIYCGEEMFKLVSITADPLGDITFKS